MNIVISTTNKHDVLTGHHAKIMAIASVTSFLKRNSFYRDLIMLFHERTWILSSKRGSASKFIRTVASGPVSGTGHPLWLPCASRLSRATTRDGPYQTRDDVVLPNEL